MQGFCLSTCSSRSMSISIKKMTTRSNRVQKNLAVLNKRAKGGCSCMCMLLSMVGMVALVVIIWLLVKYL
ncbi:hypothetical protein GYH30_005618 [Glycine max]|uniref:Syntaxin-52 n=1 Tax=Glycine soja TaxID=3848 RepID=A0A445LVZ1_GLYSO|nr:hypothetical protein JHK86_005773 [Glycine max]KAH1062751.1 hypothetical protein GYH30_005618 [Glycine max]RZC27356.1 Syntaxin-52 [Glycine soja]